MIWVLHKHLMEAKGTHTQASAEGFCRQLTEHLSGAGDGSNSTLGLEATDDEKYHRAPSLLPEWACSEDQQEPRRPP